MTVQNFVPVTAAACRICGVHLSPIGYARIRSARLYKPEYHCMDEPLCLAAYERYLVSEVRRLLDYDRVVNWTRTTSRLFVGVGKRLDAHPLRNYLNDVFPLSQRRVLWEVFPSACDAFKGLHNVPHTSAFTMFKVIDLTAEYLSFNLYAPLPLWTHRLLSQLQTIPFGCKISAETFLTFLRTTR